MKENISYFVTLILAKPLRLFVNLLSHQVTAEASLKPSTFQGNYLTVYRLL